MALRNEEHRRLKRAPGDRGEQSPPPCTIPVRLAKTVHFGAGAGTWAASWETGFYRLTTKPPKRGVHE